MYVWVGKLASPDEARTAEDIAESIFAVRPCGVVWCGVVWRGVAWCGVVWRGVVWYCVVWCGVVWYDVVWFVWCGMAGGVFIYGLPKS